MPEEITELTAHLQQQSKKSLPKWEELPDIDLYMDQVIETVADEVVDQVGDNLTQQLYEQMRRNLNITTTE